MRDHFDDPVLDRLYGILFVVFATVVLGGAAVVVLFS